MNTIGSPLRLGTKSRHARVGRGADCLYRLRLKGTRHNSHTTQSSRGSLRSEHKKTVTTPFTQSMYSHGKGPHSFVGLVREKGLGGCHLSCGPLALICCPLRTCQLR
jgi:hypothetical protein